MKPYGLIYIITNVVTGKQYVGKTRLTLEQRFRKHWRDANYGNRRNTYLCNTLRKYGIKNFKIRQLDAADSPEELAEKESSSILSLNTLWPNGYNLIIRDGNLNIVTDEIRRKCGKGGRTTWERVRKDPYIREVRKLVSIKAGEAAGIRNKERIGLKVKQNTSSKYVGVSRSGRINLPWKSYQTQPDGTKKWGRFRTEEEAFAFYSKNLDILSNSL